MDRISCLWMTLLLFSAPLQSLAADEPAIEVESYSGTPFGVCRVRVQSLENPRRFHVADVTWTLTETEGRALYPAFVRESAAGDSRNARPTASNAYFLFRGDAPLQLKFDAATEVYDISSTPVDKADAHAAMLQRWWQHFQSSADSDDRSIDLVDNYSAGMLSRRLGLKRSNGISPWNATSDDNLIGVLVGFEEVRLAMQEDRLLGHASQQDLADQPLPVAASPPPITLPEPGEVDIEPLASHVPAECFYVRFGSYANFRWLRKTLDGWGGDARTITSVRGLDYGIGERLEKQLAIRETALAKLLGDQAIEDMALIGTDGFVREGASIGLVFQARNNPLLTSSINTQRAEARQKDPEVREQSLQVAGRTVSMLTTSDFRVRSFYAVDGDFHLVTTSLKIVRRFFEAGAGLDSLAGLKEYRYALAQKPKNTEDPILVYLSDPFIRLLVSPAYRVEMTRRMQADVDLQLFDMARLAAQREQQPHDSLPELMAGGFLPPDFASRPDGSGVALIEGRPVDSARGGRRTFQPVYDVEIAAVTAREAAAYQRFADFYRQLYGKMDPVAIWIQHAPAGDGDRIVMDVSVTPFTRQNIGGLANLLAPATTKRLAPIPDAVVVVEAAVNFTAKAPNTLFGGVMDHHPPFAIHEGQIVHGDPVTNQLPAFFGEHGKGMGRAWLGGSSKSLEKAEEGYFHKTDAGLLKLLYGREWDDWWMLSWNEDTPRRVSPTLKFEEHERPAQVHVRLEDVGRHKVATILQAWQYLREREGSAANARLLDSITRQWNLQQAEAVAAAESILAARLICPLNGEYRQSPWEWVPGVRGHWYSTAWRPRRVRETPPTQPHELSLRSINAIPDDYSSRLLNAFHGLDVEISFAAQTMTTHVELELGAPPPLSK